MSSDPLIVLAPFSPTEVANLMRWQSCGWVHPFTCPNREEATHDARYGDLGALVPTTGGWLCPDCNYVQNWAHRMMVEFDASHRAPWPFNDKENP